MKDFPNLKRYDLKKANIDLRAVKKRYVDEDNLGEIIDCDCIIYEDDKPILLYVTLPLEDTKYLRQACKNVKYAKSKRTTGLSSQSTIFGFSPRNAIRKDFCAVTAMARNSPPEHAVFCEFSKYLEEVYEHYFPELYAKHKVISEENVLEDWRLGKDNGVFTSGIVNKNNRLKYHFDHGNFKGVLSNMVAFKKDCAGGFLNMPEYGVSLKIGDSSLSIFDGQEILHGVSEFKTKENGYRYSVVYYSLRHMWNCEPINDEIIRVRETHLLRERNRAEGITTKADLMMVEDQDSGYDKRAK